MRVSRRRLASGRQAAVLSIVWLAVVVGSTPLGAGEEPPEPSWTEAQRRHFNAFDTNILHALLPVPTRGHPAENFVSRDGV